MRSFKGLMRLACERLAGMRTVKSLVVSLIVIL